MDAKKVSVLSALAASSCCVLPLALLGLSLAGIGTAGAAGFSTTLGSVKWFIMPLAAMGLVFSYWLYFREKKKCSTNECKMAGGRFTKIMLTISTLVISGFFVWSVYPYILGADLDQFIEESSSAQFAVLNVEGMTCGGCELAVNGAISATGLVDSVKSSFIESRVYLWYNQDRLDLNIINEALAAVGYEAELVEEKKGNR